MAPQSSPPASSQAKKQQSISSFFTPKTSTPKAAVSSGQPSNKENNGPSNIRSVSGTKRARAEVSVSNEDTPQLKRKCTVAIDDEQEASTGVRLPEPESSRKALSPVTHDATNRLRVSDRTSKYLFSSSPLQAENESDQDTEEKRAERARLHQKFVKKLGRPDSIAEIKRRNGPTNEEAQGEDDDADENGNAEAGSPPPGAKSNRGAAKKGGTKLTPMEKQIIDLKKKHMDTVLVVEVGYKFRFFGEDARIAAKELSIVCIPGKFRYDEHPSEAHLDRFAGASFPVHRLHVHVKRLVAAGHKVGVVRQLETAALKAVGDNRNAPFVRKLTNLYTKGTYIDDVEGLEGPTLSSEGAPTTGYLLCLTETNAKGWGDDEKVHVGVVAVQPATGDIIYDDFEDGFMRSEVETRLLHIAPCEFLIVGELSKQTEKMVSHLSGSKTNVFGDRARVERVPRTKTIAAEAYSHISNFYAERVQSSQETSTDSARSAQILDQAHQLSEHVSICLSAMIKHMSEYGLEHVFDLTKYFQAFSGRTHMLLNGNALASLEIYQNQTDHSEKGSLFHCVNRTKTRFGHRLLRKWVGRPLLDKAKLEERIQAIEELKDGERTLPVDKATHILTSIKGDLEKSLLRIYYKRCNPSELLAVLQSLQRIAQEYAGVTSPENSGFKSPLIGQAIATLPTIHDNVIQYLEKINPEAARRNDKTEFFREEHETEDIENHKCGIGAVEADLSAHLVEAAAKLGKKKLEYKVVAGIEYLIELDNTESKKVPASWRKISGTKKVSRWHTPEVIRFIRERDQHKESLDAACDAAFNDLLTDIGLNKYQSLRDCIQSLALLDSLLSLADVAGQPGYVKPTFSSSSSTTVSVTGARHPMVEQTLDAYIPNDINLSQSPAIAPRALLLTGPNMGGKSSYVRSVALISILGQIGSYVPASSASLPLLDAVYTRMGANDNIFAGASTFMVELSETADILKQATPRSLVLLDELGRGTSTHDGVAIAGAVLDYVVRDIRALTLFVTHYQSLSRVASTFEQGVVRNVHMRFETKSAAPAEVANSKEAPDGENEEEVTFLYEVAEGTAHRSYGLNVARLAGVPREVLGTAKMKSSELEEKMRGVAAERLAKVTKRIVGGADEESLETLLSGIDQL